MKSIITAALALAITLTLAACEEKKKQDGTTTEPAAAETQQPSQEAAAPKPAENTGGGFKTVKIGNQTWMAENLNIETGNSKCYDNDPANCQKYGRLYDLKAAKTACPSGWKLPSKEEWDVLVDFAGGEQAAGKKLKAKSGWENNGNGTDEFGFSALPGGWNSGGSFDNVGKDGHWWSTPPEAYNQYMLYNYDYVGSDFGDWDGYLLSVRCIQN